LPKSPSFLPATHLPPRYSCTHVSSPHDDAATAATDHRYNAAWLVRKSTRRRQFVKRHAMCVDVCARITTTTYTSPTKSMLLQNLGNFVHLFTSTHHQLPSLDFRPATPLAPDPDDRRKTTTSEKFVIVGACRMTVPGFLVVIRTVEMTFSQNMQRK